jgi:hypothetical protein
VTPRWSHRPQLPVKSGDNVHLLFVMFKAPGKASPGGTAEGGFWNGVERVVDGVEAWLKPNLKIADRDSECPKRCTGPYIPPPCGVLARRCVRANLMQDMAAPQDPSRLAAAVRARWRRCSLRIESTPCTQRACPAST